MRMLERIMLATDFGQTHADTLRMALAVARTFQSEILLVHVVPEIPDSPFDLEPLKAGPNRRMQDLRSEIIASGMRVAEPIVTIGSPFNEIIELADVHDVNVIIVGSGDQRAESQFRLGLTAEKLIRKARKPVWVVKAGATGEINAMLCPVDFSDPARRALTNAIHLARTFRAHLSVLTVIQPLAQIFVSSAELAGAAQAKFAEAQQQQFDRFLADFDFHHVRWHKTVRHGRPHEEILSLVREQNVDLLVIGSTGRTGLARILMGSVAEEVIREMPCSVIAVKSEHAVRLRVEQEIVSMEAHVVKGRELLEAGFAPEAVREFQQCLATDMRYVSAWEGLAAAHQRLGHVEEAERCRQTAERTRQSYERSRIEAILLGELYRLNGRR